MLASIQRNLIQLWFNLSRKGEYTHLHIVFDSGLCLHIDSHGDGIFDYTLSLAGKGNGISPFVRKEASQAVFWIELDEFIARVS